MRPYRKIKRNYNKPFFSDRRRGLKGISLLIFAVVILGTSAGLLTITTVYQEQMRQAALELLGWAPEPGLSAAQLAERGFAFFNEGKLQKALADFELALEQRPDDINYLYEYGRILIEADDFTSASEIGDRAIAAAEDDERAYALKARALMWSDPASAIPLAITGLELNQEFAPLHAVLAVAYTNIGRYADGYQRGLRATELDPLDSFSHRAFSRPLIYTGRNQQAIDELEMAVALNPNLTGPYFELAAQYKLTLYYEMAVGIYQRVLDLEPDSAKAYLRICQTYAEIGEFRAATPFCETAIEIDENYAAAWQWLGQMRYTRRNYEGTLEAMDRCIALGSTAVECFYMRGWSRYVLDRCQDAWDDFQMALTYTREARIISIIDDGLGAIRANCPGFASAALPTPIPPTPILPTPIGGI